MAHKCIICGSSTRIINHPKTADFYYCSTCDFIAKDDQQLISKQQELQIYERHNNSIDDPVYVEYFNRFLKDAVFPFVNNGKLGFDFGSGPSPVLSQILKRDHDYQMDIYDPFYAPDKTYIGKKYDLITSTEVVEHLSDSLMTFRLFVKLLKPNGVLAIMTLFHQQDDEAFLKWHYVRDHSHIAFYTAKTMAYIAKEVGLKMIYTNDCRYTTFVLDR